MNTTKVLLASVVGCIVAFLLGWLFYGYLLVDFNKSNAGSATGVDKEAMVMWALILGNFVWAFLLAYIFDRWAGVSSWMGGLTAGALITFLMALSFDLTMFGTTNIMTLKGVLVDPLIQAVMGGIVGAAIGFVLGYGKTAA